ncbi:5-methylcytosine-specific restriction endonuclease McrA [Silvimonas terrae]|uniref:5-methylcytosine-specific restriction endonuclease McrA n=1 Tax=Silvimonas terrae TaxID=300266 RepID=A0A840RA70_9NEIS|nr:HNH endonuclease signature motif containing protein [Silvimonas terrae]MBB5189428.1 5-methylcytosine-specific restriction endonuclease McrA [Silvimonas terrae]
MVEDYFYQSCFRAPIPEIADAARYLDAAVSAHLSGHRALAIELLKLADMPAIREWTESIWGRGSAYIKVRTVEQVAAQAPIVRVVSRMPNAAEKQALLLRDGFHCRFCGIPVIRAETRKRIAAQYPDALPWGKKNNLQHAGFQAMWAQYDHILPHAKGGDNSIGNMVITCAPCNFGRMQYTLDETALLDPREREPIRSLWDGLERFR